MKPCEEEVQTQSIARLLGIMGFVSLFPPLFFVADAGPHG